MTSSYPGGLDSLTNPSSSDSLNSPSHAGQHTDANDAIEAIEATLGTDPQGSEATVKARIAALEASGGSSDAAGALVQTVSGASISSGGAITCTAPSAGNILILVATTDVNRITSVVQTNVTWERVGLANVRVGNYMVLDVWKGTAAASAGTSVTVTFEGNNTQYAMLFEYSGLSDVDALIRSSQGQNQMVDSSLVWPNPGGRVFAAYATRWGSGTLSSAEPSALWNTLASTPHTSSGFGWRLVADYDASSDGARGITFNPIFSGAQAGPDDNQCLVMFHLVP